MGYPWRPEEGDRYPGNGIPGSCDYLAFVILHNFSATALLLVENLLSKSKLTDKLGWEPNIAGRRCETTTQELSENLHKVSKLIASHQRQTQCKIAIEMPLLRASISTFMGNSDCGPFLPKWLVLWNKYIWCISPVTVSLGYKFLGDYKFKTKWNKVFIWLF